MKEEMRYGDGEGLARMGIRMTMQIEGRNIKWHNEHRGRQRKNNLFLVLYDVSQLIPEYGKFLKIIRELCVAKTI